MDIVLKGTGTDRVEANRLVRERFDIPVVYLTAHADQATLHRAKITEPFGYILKPFEERELFSGIEMALYRHRAEKRIEENERWLATILASLSEGVIAADAIGVVKLVNAAAERIGGWRPGELTGLDLSEVYRLQDPASGLPVEVPSLPLLLEDCGAGGAPQVRLLQRKDGSERLIEQTVSPISDSSGTVSGSVVVFREIRDMAGVRGDQP